MFSGEHSAATKQPGRQVSEPRPITGPSLETESKTSILPISARLAELFTSGDVPTADEQLQLAALVQKRSAEVVATRQMIEQLESTLRKAEQERDDCARILSKMRLVPTEILSEIFLLTIPIDSAHHNACVARKEEMYDSMDVHKCSPWVLMRVSKRWRDIALSCPALWAHITLVVDSRWRTAAYTKHIEATVRTQLILAQSVPLYISLFSPTVSIFGLTKSFSHSIQLLMDNRHRWRSFFCALQQVYIYHLLSGNPGNYHQLRSLFISYRSKLRSLSDYPADRLAEVFKDAASLKKFGGSTKVFEERILDATKVVEYEEQFLDSSLNADALLKMHNLRKLTLQLRDKALPRSNLPHPAFPFLTHLTISAARADTAGKRGFIPFLQGVKIPNLRYLSLAHPPSAYTNFHQLRDLLVECGARLLELSIDFCNCSEHDTPHTPEYGSPKALVDFLSSPPLEMLEGLFMNNAPHSFTGPILSKLTLRSMERNRFVFLPNLQRLHGLGNSQDILYFLLTNLHATRPHLCRAPDCSYWMAAIHPPK